MPNKQSIRPPHQTRTSRRRRRNKQSLSSLWCGGKGVLILEVLIAVFIISIALISLFGLAIFSLKISNTIKQTLEANNLSQEAIEAVRNFRDRTTWAANGLGILNTGSSNPYWPELDTVSIPSQWLMSSGVEVISGFTRKIVFEKVSRTINDDIESIYNPSNNDPNTRKVIVNVSWLDKNVEISTYLTNWK